MSAEMAPSSHVSNIYLDESGTHDDAKWLVIGMLFVRSHGALHSDLLAAKKKHNLLNKTARSSTFAEISLKDCGSAVKLGVAKDFYDLFLRHDCYFRCLAFDWQQWQGKHFGDAFEADALKKRRAYKKWCELLLHCEVDSLNATDLFLDELRMVREYDVLTALQERFTKNYKGNAPRIRKWVHAKSWQDEHQCLQLCDLLTGAVYRSLAGCTGYAKQAVDYFASQLKAYPSPKPIQLGSAGYWSGFHKTSLAKHFPKFSQWLWKPT